MESPYGLKKLYEAIGLVVTQWSMVEQSLDMCVAMVFHSPGAHVIEPKIPASTKRKAELIKKGLKTLPQFSKYKKEGLALIQRVMDTKDERHHLVHSVLASMEHQDGVYSYIGLKPDGDFHFVRGWTFDLKNLPALEQRLGGLAIDLHQFARDLFEGEKGRRRLQQQ